MAPEANEDWCGEIVNDDVAQVPMGVGCVEVVSPHRGRDLGRGQQILEFYILKWCM